MGNTATSHQFAQSQQTETVDNPRILTFTVNVMDNSFITLAKGNTRDLSISILTEKAKELGIDSQLVVDTNKEQKVFSHALIMHCEKQDAKPLTGSNTKPNHIRAHFIYPDNLEHDQATKFEDKCLQVMKAIQYSIAKKDAKTGVTETGSHLKIALSAGVLF